MPYAPEPDACIACKMCGVPAPMSASEVTKE